MWYKPERVIGTTAEHVRLAFPKIDPFDWYWVPEGDGIRVMFRTEELKIAYEEFDIWDLPIGRPKVRGC